jgi:hypothetical protein
MHALPVRRRGSLGLAALLWGLWLLSVAPAPAQAQGVELAALRTTRADGALLLEFSARLDLPKAVEEALARGVPVYFVAEATLRRHRWYWRDERVATVSRSWRVAYQPLLGTWRVGLGGLSQSHATLAEALAAASSSSSWKLADLSQLDPDRDYYVEFEYRLDISQLPSPMQFGLTRPGGLAGWAVGVSRVLRVE